MFSMIARKGTFYLGIFIFIIPFLGFPTMWKMFLVVVAGLSMILYSVRLPMPKKSFKQKIKKENFPIETIDTSIKTETSTVSEPLPVVQKPEISPEPVREPIKMPPIVKIEPAVKKARKTKASSSVKKIIVKE